MKRMLVAIGLAAVALTACQKKEEYAEAPAAAEAASPAAADAATSAEAAPPSATVQRRDPGRPLNLDLPSLAYAHEYRVEAPSKSIPDLVRRHEQLCEESGPTQCQVLGADVSTEGKDEATGRLELRATPQWVKMFRPGLEADVRAAGGELRSAGTDTEDLTQSVQDTEAALKSKIAVRDRLRGMLQRRGKLSDVMEVERELQRVQEEIDATTSSLKQMNTRVEASRVTIDYRSTTPVAGENAMKPFTEAPALFTRTLISVLGAIVWIGAVALPFGLVVGPFVWLALRRKKGGATAS